jgi:putative hemolysin
VEAGEAQFIRRVFQFTDRPIRAVMTPRTAIVAVEIETPWMVCVQTLLHSGYSRLPVYEESLDQVVGVLHIKDVTRVLAGAVTETALKELIHPPTFVLASQHTDDVLALFRRESTHLAMVVDEYGQVAGLVTLEDVLEELVGEIRDEYDQADEPAIVRREDGSWLVNGLESYDKVQEIVGLPDPSDYASSSFITLAGLIITQLHRLPRVGDSIMLGDYRLEVVDMDGRRIDKVLIQPSEIVAKQREAHSGPA